MAQRTNENAPVKHVPELMPVAVVTPAQGWWSGSNNVGNEVAFAPDAENRQTVIRLPEIGMPEVWTVSLYITNGLKDFASMAVKARIEFGAGGSTQILEMDWVNGAQISLPMNAVNIIAEYSDLTVTDDGTGVRLGVQLSRGRRGGNQPPVLTMDRELFVGAGTTSDLIEIPKFATRIKFVAVLPGDVTPYAATTTYITVSGNNGGAFNVQAVDGTHIVQTDGLQVVGASRFVRVINGDLVNNLRLAVYAELEG